MKNEYILSKKSNCKNCYKCIRHCPVKSIRFSSGQAVIVRDECISCGECYVVCPQDAKSVRSDLNTARRLLSEDAPVYASVAPSFAAYFRGSTFSSLQKTLKKLGFADAEETAIGATIVKKRYDEMVNEGRQDLIISTCCHTVNLLVQKYYPSALPYLAHVQSPMQAHCARIKRQHPEAKTVFIGPCISKKAEAESYPGLVDCVLTFDELSAWMEENSLVLIPQEEHIEESKARMFPTSGGILDTMEKANPDYTYLVVDGIDNCIRTLEDISDGNLGKCFIEMSACAGSCINGPVMRNRSHTPVRDYMAIRTYAGSKDFSVEAAPAKQLHKEMPASPLRREMPDSLAIKEILQKMGKTSPADELNCGTCGYDTCREKAIAVFQGKADLNMCLPFLKEKAESFSDNIVNNTPNGIIVLNEALEIQQINKAARTIMNIKYEGDILGDQVIRILDPTIFFDVMETGRNVHDQRVYLAEYRKYVEQTVIYDKSYHLIMCIMRDVTSEEQARERRETLSRQTIDITDKVIEKHMRVVQEIASLLGETTAETKVALTNLKESLNEE